MPGRSDILAGRAYVELFVKNSAFYRGLSDARNRLREFGSDMQAIGRQLAIVSAAMLVPLAAGVKTFASFDDEMKKVGARSRGTAEELEALRDTAKELGATTSFTAVQVAALQSKVAQKGFDRSGIQAITGDILNLARAAGEGGEGDTVIAADLVSGNLRAFALEANQAGYLADLFSAAVNNSNFNLEGLTSSLSDAAPIAQRYGVSVKDTVNVLAQMTNVNIDASSAGTAFRNMLLRLSNEAGRNKFNSAIEKMTGNTIDFVDAGGNLKPLPDLLFQIGDSVKSLGTAQQGEILSNLFGLRAVVAGGVLSEARNGFAELNDILSDVEGTAKRTSDEMDSGLGGTFRILLSAVEGVRLAIGEALADSLVSIGKTVTDLLGILRGLIENNQQLVVTFAKWAVGIGLAGAVLLGLGLAASAAATAIGGFMAILSAAATVLGLLALPITVAVQAFVAIGGLLAALASPVGLAVAAVAALGFVALRSSGALEAMATVAKGAMGSVSRAAGQMTDEASALFGDLKETAMATFSGIKNAIAAGDLELAGRIAVTGLRLAFLQGMQAISKIFGGIWGDTLSTFATQIAGGDFAGAWNTTVLALDAVWTTFTANLMKSFIDAARNVLKFWRGVVDGIADYILQVAANDIVFNAVFKQISGVDVREEIERNKQLGGQVGGSNEEQGFSFLGEGGDLLDRAADRIRQTVTAIGEQLGKTPEEIEEQIGSALDDLENGRLPQFEAAAEEAGKALADGVAGGSERASAEIERLQAELAALNEEAKAKLVEARAAPAKEGEGEGEGKGKGPAAGPGGEDKGKSEESKASIAVATSAAGLIALGQGGESSVQNQTLAEIREQKKAIHEGNKLVAMLLQQNIRVQHELQNLGLGLD